MWRRLRHLLITASAALGVVGSVVVAAATIESRFSQDSHIVIVGNSMLPTIKKGDAITIDPLRHPRVGDVVTFVRDGQMITHRITDLWGAFDPTGASRLLYKTKGDNNRTPDPWVVTDREIRGVQIETPLIVRLAHPLTETPMILAVLVGPLLLSILATEVGNIRRTMRDVRDHSRRAKCPERESNPQGVSTRGV